MAFWDGQVVLPEVRKGLEGPPGGPGGVGRPSRKSGKGWEAQAEVKEALPEV